MHYITKKTSETGKKFEKISIKRRLAHEDAKAFAEKYGFQQYRQANWVVFGGISSCIDFDETPDKKIWGKGAVTGEFMPKRNSKIGKAIHQEIMYLTHVNNKQLNDCIGWSKCGFNTIGYAEDSDTYFGFSVKEEWKIDIPMDCEEILTSKYRELFNTK